MKINRIWVDVSTTDGLAELTYGVGDDITLDGNTCKITNIFPKYRASYFAQQDAFDIRVDVPSGTRGSVLLVSARHVVNVELVGD